MSAAERRDGTGDVSLSQLLRVMGTGSSGTVWLIGDPRPSPASPAKAPAGATAASSSEAEATSQPHTRPQLPHAAALAVETARLPPRGAFSSTCRCGAAPHARRALKISQRTRFTECELQILAQLHHPFIVPFLGASSDSWKNYLALEAALGGDLGGLLVAQDALLSDAQARLLVACLTSAIGFVHSHGLMYRDLKPENVVLDEDGFVRLIDFGFTKAAHPRSTTLCGTLEYCAPESIQLQGHGQEVDWWALGIITYELLHGYTPFSAEGTLEDPIEIAKRITHPDCKVRSHTYTHIHTHTHTHAHTHTHTYTYTHAYTHTDCKVYTCTYTYTYIYIYTCIHTHRL